MICVGEFDGDIEQRKTIGAYRAGWILSLLQASTARMTHLW